MYFSQICDRKLARHSGLIGCQAAGEAIARGVESWTARGGAVTTAQWPSQQE